MEEEGLGQYLSKPVLPILSNSLSSDLLNNIDLFVHLFISDRSWTRGKKPLVASNEIFLDLLVGLFTGNSRDANTP